MKRVFFVLFCLFVPFRASAKTIEGEIVSLKDGRVLEMKIEKKLTKGSGKITAMDSKTGELFSGKYNAVYASGALIKKGDGVAQVVLSGDKSTVLQCNFIIQSTIGTRGLGKCTDNRGETYNLQF